ncbi:hypothetical protein SEPCBS57363_005687 [Sporothrix epigloea]|uniref:C2H2-type domain-containing protein n=1 Tax=Sporothrix epigloea TaxID=1892477 RepID=A0ABP0E040_9PEZI
MKRARECEELLPPSPPSLSLLPALDRDKTVDTDGRFAPAHDTRDLRYEPCAKIASLTWDSGEDDDEGREQVGSTMMSCLLHRERIDFPTYDAYEGHYAKEHLNRCIECRRNFPSPRYLSLHGDEWHNPFVAVKRDRGEHTYGCFVEGCDRKCGSSDKRRRHLIDKHSFPRNFFFSITQHGIDGKQSLLQDDRRRDHHRRLSLTSTVAKKDVARRRTASISLTDTAASPATFKPVLSEDDSNSIHNGVLEDTDTSRVANGTKVHPQVTKTKAAPVLQGAEETPDAVMDDVAEAMSSMTLIPRSVRFGRGGRAGFAKR